MEITRENKDDLQRSLQGFTEEEVKRILRKAQRAKYEEERTPAHKPKSVNNTLVTPDNKNVLRYTVPKRQAKQVGRENFTGHKSLTDKLGYMPLKDRLLQMERGGESLHQMRTYMAEYSLEYRKEAEQLAKAHINDWPTPIDTYVPDIAQLQQLHKDTQYKVAARFKARQEEAYRAKAMSGDNPAKTTPDKPTKSPPENTQKAPET